MKNLIFLVVLYTTLLANELNAQGWIGNGSNNLISYNSSLSPTPISIGIGTNSPTATLHSIGDLRFQSLQQANSTFNRFLLTDPNGNVRWENLSTVVRDNDWHVANTSNAPNNINDNIFSMGRVGINTSNPVGQLEIQGSNNLALLVRQGTPGVNGGIYIEENATVNSGRIFMTGNNLFIGRMNNSSPFPNDVAEAIKINQNGQVGVLLGSGNPITANFHTSGAIRFQNLPSGGGSHLVIDANGNVMVSGCTCPSAAKVDTQKEIDLLKKQVDSLEKELEVIKEKVNK